MSDHPLHLFTGTANRPLAEEIAQCLQQPLGSCTTTRLPDSEIHVQIDQVVRGEDIFFIQPCSEPVNEHLVEMLLYIDAFRRASAHSITLVIPYFPYARQERMTKGREAISAKVVATLIEALGASRVVFLDVHAPAIQGFFNIPVDPLTAVPILAEQFRREEFSNAAIVAADVGRAKLAGKYAEILGLPLVVMHKRRDSFESAHTTHVVGDIKGKIPIVIDDLIAGGSVLTQLPALVEAGAEPHVHLAITHPVLLPTALKRLDDPLIAELVVTNSILVPPHKQHPKLKIVSIAPLLANIIERIYRARSISSLLRLT